MNSTRPVLTVALPNYNGEALLRSNIPVLFRALSRLQCEVEVLVVDDGSTDDSVSALAELTTQYPSLRTVRNEDNRGFADTCNLAIEAARGTWICLVNTDVLFDEQYFAQALIPLFEGRADAVKGPIFNYSNDPQQPHFIDTQTRVSVRRGLARAEPETKPHHGTSTLIGKLGCCYVARTEVLRALGGYDGRYAPYYWEDVDLGWRLTHAGYRFVYAAEARVYHQESATIGTLDPARRKRVRQVRMRNRLLFTWTLLQGWQWLGYGLWELSRVLLSAAKGDLQYHRALVDAWRRRRSASGVGE